MITTRYALLRQKQGTRNFEAVRGDLPDIRPWILIDADDVMRDE
jgi:hypothetical protein